MGHGAPTRLIRGGGGGYLWRGFTALKCLVQVLLLINCPGAKLFDFESTPNYMLSSPVYTVLWKKNIIIRGHSERCCFDEFFHTGNFDTNAIFARHFSNNEVFESQVLLWGNYFFNDDAISCGWSFKSRLISCYGEICLFHEEIVWFDKNRIQIQYIIYLAKYAVFCKMYTNTQAAPPAPTDVILFWTV